MLNRRDVLGAGLASLFGRVFGRGTSLSSSDWSSGDSSASVSGSDGTLTIQATGDVDLVAHHFRMGTYDGNYEFEHSKAVGETHLNSYFIGTPTRTPISVGGDDDGQDVLSFIVRGKKGQKHDLQQWVPGEKPAVAIDGNGHLRLGEATLSIAVKGNTVQLIAQLANGKRVVLAHGQA